MPVWVFGGKITDASLLDFYDDLATRPRWEIGERGATMLIHRRGGARLSIGATNAGRIIDTLLP